MECFNFSSTPLIHFNYLKCNQRSYGGVKGLSNTANIKIHQLNLETYNYIKHQILTTQIKSLDIAPQPVVVY